MENKNKKLNKKEFAYQTIRNRILDGTYAPGHRIIINQLAKEFSTSAIPIREAIRQLEAENLIEYKQYSGAIVTEIDDNQYLESLTVLALLSAHATALAAKKFPKEEISKLAEMNTKMKEALEEYDFITFGNLNKEFHFFIYSYCENQFLLESIEQVHQRLDRIRRTGSAFIPPRAVESIKEHQHIIELIRDDAPFDEIESYVKKHQLNTVKAYEKRKEQNFSSFI